MSRLGRVARRGALLGVLGLAATVAMPVAQAQEPSAPDPAVDATSEAPVEVRMYLDGKPAAAGGVVVVQVERPSDAEVSVAPPTAEGLSLREAGDARVEDLGARRVVTLRYRFAGEKGSYEIRGAVARWTEASGERTVAAPSLFVDLDTPPPREGELADIADPSRVWTVPWGFVLGGLTVVGAVAAGAAVAFRPRPEVRARAPRPDPPDVRAIRAWEAARGDTSLDDHAKAVAISQIFREYAEAALSFPATALTTPEILAHLSGLTYLPDGNVPRARRLLRATDRVKFADARATADLFEDLDSDLRAFIGGTRPAAWRDPASPGGGAA